MKDTQRKKSFTAYGILKLGVLLLVLIIINVSISELNLRWDATEDKVHSLSKASEDILKNLNEKITIKYYFSDDPLNMPPHIRAYGKRVKSLLREYESRAKGKLDLEIFNPESDSEEEDWAKAYGIQELPTGSGDKLYFGLAALNESRDKEEVLGFLDPSKEASLEYEISRSISRLARKKEAKIGLLSGMDIYGSRPMPGMRSQDKWFFIKELEKSASLIKIKGEDDILPEELDLLIIMQANNLSENMLFAIDCFMTAGGRLIILQDPAAISDPMAGYKDNENPLKELLDAWGLEASDQLVVDINAATRLMGEDNQIENNPAWLSLDREAINSKNIITAALNSLLLPLAGYVDIKSEKGLESETLLFSSENSAPADAELLKMGGGLKELRESFKPSDKSYKLAISLKGQFPECFPDGPAKKEDEEDKEDAEEIEIAVRKEAKEGNLIYMADVDFLFDPYYMSRQNFLGFEMARIFNDNLNFFLNMAEILSGNEELINIRSRDVIDRPFTRVKELEQKAELHWLKKEQALLAKAEETKIKIQSLEQRREESDTRLLSEEQENELRKFNEEKIAINKELKQVRRNLRADIDRLGYRIKLINLFALPLLISLTGLFVALRRIKRSKEII